MREAASNAQLSAFGSIALVVSENLVSKKVAARSKIGGNGRRPFAILDDGFGGPSTVGVETAFIDLEPDLSIAGELGAVAAAVSWSDQHEALISQTTAYRGRSLRDRGETTAIDPT